MGMLVRNNSDIEVLDTFFFKERNLLKGFVTRAEGRVEGRTPHELGFYLISELVPKLEAENNVFCYFSYDSTKRIVHQKDINSFLSSINILQIKYIQNVKWQPRKVLIYKLSRDTDSCKVDLYAVANRKFIKIDDEDLLAKLEEITKQVVSLIESSKNRQVLSMELQFHESIERLTLIGLTDCKLAAFSTLSLLQLKTQSRIPHSKSNIGVIASKAPNFMEMIRASSKNVLAVDYHRRMNSEKATISINDDFIEMLSKTNVKKKNQYKDYDSLMSIEKIRIMNLITQRSEVAINPELSISDEKPNSPPSPLVSAKPLFTQIKPLTLRTRPIAHVSANPPNPVKKPVSTKKPVPRFTLSEFYSVRKKELIEKYSKYKIPLLSSTSTSKYSECYKLIRRKN